MGVMRILDRTGDTEVAWDRTVEATVRQAEARFEQLLAERKLAFARYGREEEPGQIRAFDPTADEILVVRPVVGG